MLGPRLGDPRRQAASLLLILPIQKSSKRSRTASMCQVRAGSRGFPRIGETRVGGNSSCIETWKGVVPEKRSTQHSVIRDHLSRKRHAFQHKSVDLYACGTSQSLHAGRASKSLRRSMCHNHANISIFAPCRLRAVPKVLNERDGGLSPVGELLSRTHTNYER